MKKDPTTTTKLLVTTTALLLTTLTVPTTQQNTDRTNTKMIIELFRHGSRTPAYNTLNFSFANILGPGNIIGNGLRMMYLLGAQVRQDYPQLFANPQNTDYHIISSNYERTINTAYAHAMGLYPPGTGLEITGDDSNQEFRKPPYRPLDVTLDGTGALPDQQRAIPVYVIDKKIDEFFMKGIGSVCPGADKSVDDRFAKLNKNNTDLNELGKKIEATQWKCAKYFDGCEAYDLNRTGIFGDLSKCYYYYYGKPLPETETFYKNLVWGFGVFYLNYRFMDNDTMKLYTTKMTEYILDEISDKIEGKSKYKYIGLSGHEANVFPYMVFYGLTSQECMVKKAYEENPVETADCYHSPETGTNFIWEVNEVEGTWTIKTRFNGDVIVKACDNMAEDGSCTLADFRDFHTKKFILGEDEYKKVCDAPEPLTGRGKLFMWAAIVVTALFVVQLISFLLYIRCLKQRLNPRRGVELKEDSAEERPIITKMTETNRMAKDSREHFGGEEGTPRDDGDKHIVGGDAAEELNAGYQKA